MTQILDDGTIITYVDKLFNPTSEERAAMAVVNLPDGSSMVVVPQ